MLIEPWDTSTLLRLDAMNEYVRHTSSAGFACPPGVRGDDDWWGRALFED
jgi:deferrochelatase/peroxidase EfeB